MATIGSRRNPKAYRNGSTVRLTKANDVAFVSSSSSQFDLGGGNDYFYVWGNLNTVVTSGGIDQLSLVGNSNTVKAQGANLNSSAYFVGSNNYFFNDFTIENKQKFKVIFNEGRTQTAEGSNLNIEWNSKAVPNKKIELSS